MPTRLLQQNNADKKLYMNTSSKHKIEKKILFFFFWQNEEELYVDKMHKTVWFREQLSPSIYRACLSLIQYIIPWDRKWYKNVQIL